jgi:chitin disaccharide deacetylase
MPTVRRVIINADDFGETDGLNRGIIEAHRQGVVTSTSLMPRGPAAGAAAAHAKDNPGLSFGLHVDLGAWQFTGGQWAVVYEVCDLQSEQAIRDEVRRQLELYRRIMGRDPSHLDSHQNVHRVREPLRTIFRELAGELGVTLRHMSDDVLPNGGFWGRNEDYEPDLSRLTAQQLIQIFANLPAGSTTELSCHPGYTQDLDSDYRDERLVELRVLCRPEVRSAIADLGIELISFDDFNRQRTRR